MTVIPMPSTRRSVELPLDRLARWAGRIVAKATLMTAVVALLTALTYGHNLG